MRSATMAAGFVVVLAFHAPRPAWAASPDPVALEALPAPASSAPSPVATAPTPAPTAGPRGLAVVALPGSAAVAWPLALLVYQNGGLRPPKLDDAHARALCGEPPPAQAPADVRELSDTVSALSNGGAAARAILSDIATRLGVRALVVVNREEGHATARVFLPESHDYDAATYSPDAGTDAAWTVAARSLARTYAAPPVPMRHPAPALATTETPSPVDSSAPRPFYTSPWFWGALGVAACTAGGVYLLSRDTGPSTIHLQLQVPSQ